MMGIRPAGSVGWKLKQFDISYAAASHWLVSAIMSLGQCLANQVTYAQFQ
jgi:hypothetical protein